MSLRLLEGVLNYPLTTKPLALLVNVRRVSYAWSSYILALPVCADPGHVFADFIMWRIAEELVLTIDAAGPFLDKSEEFLSYPFSISPRRYSAKPCSILAEKFTNNAIAREL